MTWNVPKHEKMQKNFFGVPTWYRKKNLVQKGHGHPKNQQNPTKIA